MAAKQLSDLRSDGVTMGQSATDLLAFYGGTPKAQPTNVAAVTTTAATSTTNAFGYTTSTQADAIVTSINAILTRVEDLSLFASA